MSPPCMKINSVDDLKPMRHQLGESLVRGRFWRLSVKREVALIIAFIEYKVRKRVILL